MSKAYKNKLRLRPNLNGDKQREEITRGIIDYSTPLPQTLLYKDIDESFKEWVENELNITFEEENIPTISLFSNQRFSEYMQSWKNVDSKKNIILNFKAITRENNPKSGTIIGQTKNIPGDYSVLLKTIEARDRNNRKYYIDYRMRQPMSIDLIYTVSLLTNKYELLNEFNLLMNEKFKSITCYIKPNGHFVPMKLNDISDESEYSIDNRQFYSQSYNITVMAYIITEDDYIIEERPEIKFIGYEGDNKSYADIEEFDNTKYDFISSILTISIGIGKTSYKFNIDTDFVIDKIETNNIRSYRTFINDNEVDLKENFKIFNNDEIKVKGVIKYNVYEESKITIIGHNPYETEKK